MLLTLQHLANAPRAQKESAALACAGADVTILGSWWDASRAEEDRALEVSLNVRFIPLLDLRPGASGSTFPRIMGRIARVLFRRLGIVLPEVYGLTARKMLRMVRELDPDLVMVHCEPGLWASTRLLNEGYRVGVDFEDWFSEDLLPDARVERPVDAIATAERLLLRRGVVRFTPTRAMAYAMQQWSGIERPPVVIPNCFRWSDRASVPSRMKSDRDEGVSFYWFSQTIGPGRGLEELGKALIKVNGSWRLRLRGILRAPAGWFESTFPESIRDQIDILEPVSNAELLEHHMDHDVGLALEIPFCRSRDLTATNKIFDYLRSGLAVIATDTRGQREVMSECPDAGWIVPPSDVDALSVVLQSAVADSEGLTLRKLAARDVAEKQWAWEHFESVVVDAIGDSIARADLIT